ncbi:hypothetical protein V6Z12_A05G279000 [Gossypium hirsutum]
MEKKSPTTDLRRDSSVRGMGERWLACEVAKYAWRGQWWERQPQ